MLSRALPAVALVLAIGQSDAFLRKVYGNSPIQQDNNGGSGKPLILTPFIEDGQLELARNLSLVGPLKGDNIPSYSGYFTVNKTTDSNLFFWFFPAEVAEPEKQPTLLWLQGGPGGSSLFGLFVENGPYIVTKHQVLKMRHFGWTKKFNMIYIDNPVGTGYSYTKSDDGYATNQVDVGRDLFEGLQQFFTIFSDYAKTDFYITGESYAGKYVPAAAYTIYKNKASAKMNLKGIAIGDGLCDPETMLDYATFLQQVGLIDDEQALHFKTEQDKAKVFIQNSQFKEAFGIFDELLNGDKLNGSKPYFKQVTGLDFYYNFLLTEEPKSFGYYNKFVQDPQTRQAIHVGDNEYHDGSMVETKLEEDVMKSVKPWIAELMENYKVMIYNGQLDIIIAYPLTSSFVNSIQWSGAKEFATAKRQIWRNPITKNPAGYVRQVGKFTEVLVRNAGHILPYDQPANGFDMIDRFINDKPF